MNILIAIIYLIISLIALFSFVKKKNENYISLYIFLAFFLYFINRIIIIFFYVDYSLNYILVNLDILGSIFLFRAAGSIHSVVSEKKIRKIFISLFIIINIAILLFFNYEYMISNKEIIAPLLFVDEKLNLIYFSIILFYLFLMICHLPNIFEYNIFKLIGLLYFIKYSLLIINLYHPIDISVIPILVSVGSFIFFLSISKVYYDSYKKIRKDNIRRK